MQDKKRENKNINKILKNDNVKKLEKVSLPSASYKQVQILNDAVDNEADQSAAYIINTTPDLLDDLSKHDELTEIIRTLAKKGCTESLETIRTESTSKQNKSRTALYQNRFAQDLIRKQNPDSALEVLLFTADRHKGAPRPVEDQFREAMYLSRIHGFSDLEKTIQNEYSNQKAHDLSPVIRESLSDHFEFGSLPRDHALMVRCTAAKKTREILDHEKINSDLVNNVLDRYVDDTEELRHQQLASQHRNGTLDPDDLDVLLDLGAEFHSDNLERLIFAKNAKTKHTLEVLITHSQLANDQITQLANRAFHPSTNKPRIGQFLMENGAYTGQNELFSDRIKFLVEQYRENTESFFTGENEKSQTAKKIIQIMLGHDITPDNKLVEDVISNGPDTLTDIFKSKINDGTLAAITV